VLEVRGGTYMTPFQWFGTFVCFLAGAVGALLLAVAAYLTWQGIKRCVCGG